MSTAQCLKTKDNELLWVFRSCRCGSIIALSVCTLQIVDQEVCFLSLAGIFVQYSWARHPCHKVSLSWSSRGNKKRILWQIVREIWQNFKREVMHEAHSWWANSSTSQVQYHSPVHLGHLHFPVIHAVLNTWSYFEISLAVWIRNVSLALI